MPHARRGVLCLVLMLSAFAGHGCAEDGPFESDTPRADGSDDLPRGDVDDDAPGIRAGTWTEPPSPTYATAQRVLAEADLVQLSGDRLIAVSSAAGLNVIDVEEPTQPVLLGHAPDIAGKPFALYVRDGVVLALFTGWKQFVDASVDAREVEVSKLIAYDVTHPTHIAQLGSLDIPGVVDAAHLAGDVLYVVGRDEKDCFPGAMRRTDCIGIRSVDLRDPHRLLVQGSLSFSSDDGFGNQRQVSIGEQHIFVALAHKDTAAGIHSSVQVVDISDPSGALAQGSVLEVPGKITQPWQLNEHQGILRVTSQATSWAPWEAEAPSVELYRLAADDITHLASLPLQVPNGGRTLRSVHFDGPRAYAIPEVPTDPVFMVDLTDPEQPRQQGELVLPGSIQHLAPRGERLFGVSHQRGNPDGAIAVSLFDVADLAAPTLLSRVNVGAQWAGPPGNQADLDQAFRVEPDSQLVVLPLLGSNESSGATEPRCVSKSRSAVQLLDLKGDTLSLRASLSSEAEVRRALVHRDRLLAVSDTDVAAYDLGERGRPRELPALTLARYVERVEPLADGVVARVNVNYWSSALEVDFVRAEEVEAPQRSLGSLSLDRATLGDGECAPYRLIEDVFGHDRQLEILYRRFEYTLDSRESRELAGVLVVDATDLSAPRLVGKVEWVLSDSPASYSWHGESAGVAGRSAPGMRGYARLGDTLIALETATRQSKDSFIYSARLRSVDLTDPARPTTHITELPPRDYTGLSVAGDDVLLGIREPGSRSGRVRFHVQEVDARDPANVQLGEEINVPGLLLYHDAVSRRIVSSELTRVTVGGTLSASDCAKRFGGHSRPHTRWHHDSDIPTGPCTGYRQTLHLSRLVGGRAELEDSLALENERVMLWASASDERLFMVLGNLFAASGTFSTEDCEDCEVPERFRIYPQLLSLGGIGSGQLEAGRFALKQNVRPSWRSLSPLHAFGTHALVASDTDVSLFDAADVRAPMRTISEALLGPLTGVSLQDGEIFLARGTRGALRLSPGDPSGD
jgi:hypothetical protein